VIVSDLKRSDGMTSLRRGGRVRAYLVSLALIGAGSSAGCLAIYQAERGTDNGYSETRLNDDTFNVVYTGYPSTKPDRREAFLLYRCAQLTVQQGYENFVILQVEPHRHPANDVSDGNESFPTAPREALSIRGGAITSRTLNDHTRYRSHAFIKMFHGSKADVPVSYNAKEVMAHLRVSVYGERESAGIFR
jgi:hypothetical protein